MIRPPSPDNGTPKADALIKVDAHVGSIGPERSPVSVLVRGEVRRPGRHWDKSSRSSDQRGAEPGAGVEAGERDEEMTETTVLRLDGSPAPVQPAAQALDRRRVPTIPARIVRAAVLVASAGP